LELGLADYTTQESCSNSCESKAVDCVGMDKIVDTPKAHFVLRFLRFLCDLGRAIMQLKCSESYKTDWSAYSLPHPERVRFIPPTHL
jgi:hypothetical protein